MTPGGVQHNLILPHTHSALFIFKEKHTMFFQSTEDCTLQVNMSAQSVLRLLNPDGQLNLPLSPVFL